MMTHLLDTSAWLAHVFREPGSAVVTTLIADPQVGIGISSLSIIEAHARFRALNRTDDFGEMWESYRDVFERVLAVDESVVMRAISLRETAAARIPTIDVLIAATAAQHNAILVHRDPHFTALPADALTQHPLAQSPAAD